VSVARSLLTVGEEDGGDIDGDDDDKRKERDKRKDGKNN
jgi:hypothetical protein